MEEEIKSAFAYAMNRIARRDYSVTEMQRILKSKFDANISQKTVAFLQKKKFLDDERYSEILIRILRNRGKGIIFIRNKFREKGVSQSIFERLLQDGAGNQANLAKKQLEKKFEHKIFEKSNLTKDKARAIKFLIGRGFPPSSVYEVVSEFFDNL